MRILYSYPAMRLARYVVYFDKVMKKLDASQIKI
jgi:hypothetical protein